MSLVTLFLHGVSGVMGPKPGVAHGILLVPGPGPAPPTQALRREKLARATGRHGALYPDPQLPRLMACCCPLAICTGGVGSRCRKLASSPVTRRHRDACRKQAALKARGRRLIFASKTAAIKHGPRYLCPRYIQQHLHAN